MAKFLRKPKRNIAMRLAAVLFCLTLVSFYMVSGLFAKYMTRGQGSDSARVIKFGNITLTETGDFYDDKKTSMWIIPGKDIAKSATVSFEGSEAATYVFVEVQVSKHWTYATVDDRYVFTMAGGNMKWQIAEGWEQLSESVYYKELAPNETLTADIIDGGVITVSHKITRETMRTLENVDGVKTPISIVFSASVVQGNGFATAAKAWDSLSGKGVGV